MVLPKSLTTVTTFSKAIAMILFILLPFVGFYVGYKYNGLTYSNTPVAQNNLISTPTITSTPNPTANSAINWKTYTNSKSNYSIKYPSWVHVIPSTDGFFLESEYLDPNSKEFKGGLYTHGKGFSISIKTEKAMGTLRDFFNKEYINECKNTKVKLGKEEFTKIDSNGCYLGGDSYHLQKNGTTYSIWTNFEYDEQLYGANFQEEAKKGQETVGQILSTFRFDSP